MNDLELKAKIKSTFRVVESDKFYIQEKQRLGWSYHVNKNWSDDGNTTISNHPHTNLSSFPWWYICISLTSSFALVGGVVSFFIGILSNLITIIPLLICAFIFFVCLFLLEYIGTKEKKFSFEYSLLCNAEEKVNDLVNDRIKGNEAKIKKKEKKYHYFYTTKQLRKEKLLKIKK